MLKILLVAQDFENLTELEEGIINSGYQVVAKLDIKANLLIALENNEIDVIVIDVDTPRARLLDQMKVINELKPTPIVVFSEKSNESVIQAVVDAGVSAYVIDGLSSSRVKSIVDMAIARFRSTKALRDELQKAKTSLEDRKLIDKAKGIIMKQRSCDEDDAYKTLRKMAMDNNKKIGQMANDVINVFASIN